MADTVERPDLVTMPTVTEIFARPAPVTPDATVRDLLSIGADMIAICRDDLAAQVLGRVCLALATTADDLAIARIMLSESQTLAQTQHVEIRRLRQRNTDLLELARGGE